MEAVESRGCVRPDSPLGRPRSEVRVGLARGQRHQRMFQIVQEIVNRLESHTESHQITGYLVAVPEVLAWVIRPDAQ